MAKFKKISRNGFFSKSQKRKKMAKNGVLSTLFSICLAKNGGFLDMPFQTERTNERTDEQTCFYRSLRFLTGDQKIVFSYRRLQIQNRIWKWLQLLYVWINDPNSPVGPRLICIGNPFNLTNCIVGIMVNIIWTYYSSYYKTFL